MRITCSKCGNFLELNKLGIHTYCNPCHAEWQKAYLAKRPDIHPEEKKKRKARSLANVYQRMGKLTQQPCEKCGSKDSEKHHEDYDKPLLITWLCRPCHLDLHRKINSEVLETGALK